MQKFKLRFKNWGFFENGLGFWVFVKIFQNLWLGWVPFDICVSVLAPWGILSLYWGRFLHVHALFIVKIHCCMLGVWQNVLVTFLCWIGLNWVPMLGFYLDWSCLSCFGQCLCVLHTMSILCLNAMPCITRHISCISCCIPMLHMLHTHASAHAQHRHTHAQWFTLCILLLFT